MEPDKQAQLKKIEILLDKYWQGESSREEENALRSYFNSDNVADHLKYVKPLFVVLQQNRDRKLADSFDERLQQRMGAKEPYSFRSKKKRLVIKITKIAASLIMLLAVTYWFRVEYTVPDKAVHDPELGTFNDPHEAYRQVKASLELVSGKLNKGTDYMKTLSRFNKGATLFDKQKKQKIQE